MAWARQPRDGTLVAEFGGRWAGPADAGLLAEMGRRTFLAAFGAANTPEDLALYLAAAYGEREQAAELADPATRFLLAEHGAVPAGYAKLVGGTAGERVEAEAPIEVQRLYADLPFLGRGVGSFLMELILEHAVAAGHDVVWLAVWEHNPGARRFYERWGFRVVGEQPFTLGRDVQRDLVMVRGVAEG